MKFIPVGCRIFGRSPVRSLPAGAVVLLWIVLTIMSACSGESSGQSQIKNSKKAQAVPVTVSTVMQKTVPVELHAIGTVQAYSTVAIKSQVEGTLTQVYFKEGQEMKKGDLLFTIDRRPFEVQLKQVEADLARDKAQAENAQLQVRRYEQLVKKDYISQEQYDQVRATAAALEATVLADEAAVEQAKLKLDYCSIQTPIDGMAGNLLVHVGNLVKANDADHPLVVINQIRPIYVAFFVPGKYLSEVQRYRTLGPLTVEAIPSDRTSPPVQGKMTSVNNTVNTETGMIQLKALFPNDKKTLWPGQFVNVVLTLTTQPNAIVVPSQAIQVGQQGSYVFVVRPDLTVEARPIGVGNTIDGETVVENGLVPGEQVVTDGQLRLTSGTQVEIKTTAPTVADPEKTL